MMIRTLLCCALASAAPAFAQHQHHMLDMEMPAAVPPPQPHQHSSPPPADADPHAGHDMGDAPPPPDSSQTASDTALPPGNSPPPPLRSNRLADHYFPSDQMARAEDRLLAEHGAMTYYQFILNLAEVQIRNGRDARRWDGMGWFGGDIDRFVLSSEGEALRGGSVEHGEVQALWSHALDPYWNLQAGVRQDLQHGPDRTYLTLGIEGLAPYWFDVEARLFLSYKGDLLARIEGHYDQRITRRFVLQPRVELNLAAQDVAESGIGSGLSTAEAGLRLRYEFAREFAPYIGVSWERRLGDTARFARAAGEDVEGTSLVAGMRFWF